MIEYKKWLMGFKYGTETGKEKILSELRTGNDEKEVQRKTGRFEDISKKEVLQSKLCEYEDRYYKVGLALAGKEIQKEELRMLWDKQEASGSPHRRKLQESEQEQFTDFMCMVSQIYPSYGREAWQKGTWESSVNRVDSGIKNRVDRLKAIGNGQVPAVAAIAFLILYNRIQRRQHEQNRPRIKAHLQTGVKKTGRKRH